MAHTIHLETRQTHRYVGTHRRFDHWEHVGTARVLPPKLVREPRDEEAYYDEGTYLMHARAPTGQNPALTAQALRDHFSSWGCSHEHDCCGCRSSQARVRRLGPRDFAVFVDYSRNY